MKIVYIHQYFTFPEESGGTRSYDLATSFAKKGHHVEVVTTSAFIKTVAFEKRWALLERNGLKIHVLNLNYSNHLSAFKRSLVFLQFLWFSTFKVLSLKTDVVLATSTPLTIGIPALIKKIRHKTSFVFEVRDVWPEAMIAIGAVKNRSMQKVLYALEKNIYKNASAIVPLSTDMMQSITSRYPFLKEKPIQVIENIAEINRFQNGYNAEKSMLQEKIGFVPRFPVVYAGTFGRVNGINYVVDLALETGKLDDSIVFILIGNGFEKDAVIENAKNKGVLNKNVFILDSIPKNELAQLYFECSMGSSFVIDIEALWANSANKFFDTLAAGRPILINHPGWQKHIIEERNMGYVLSKLADATDVKKFVEYTQDSNLIEQQRMNALVTAKEKYSLDIAIAKYEDVFKQIKVTPYV